MAYGGDYGGSYSMGLIPVDHTAAGLITAALFLDYMIRVERMPRGPMPMAASPIPMERLRILMDIQIRNRVAVAAAVAVEAHRDKKPCVTTEYKLFIQQPLLNVPGMLIRQAVILPAQPELDGCICQYWIKSFGRWRWFCRGRWSGI